MKEFVLILVFSLCIDLATTNTAVRRAERDIAVLTNKIETLRAMAEACDGS
ncbi:MAG: hypothetical protein AAGE52_30385 [Myxococcota bacterium]